jgi:mercuric ion transport protein
MKAALGGIGAAFVASACCIGPVAFSLIGVGAVGASAVVLEPYRPWFIALTALLVASAFYHAYKPLPADACTDDRCPPQSRRIPRLLAWIAAIAAAVLIAFPYYIGWFV